MICLFVVVVVVVVLMLKLLQYCNCIIIVMQIKLMLLLLTGYTRVYKVHSITRVNIGTQDIYGYTGYTVLLG